MSYQPIENYEVIGDLPTVALVGMNGSIDFMCYPHFDSPSLFAALPDHHRGGSFRVAPLHDELRYRQMYLTDTNILLTRFLSRSGVAEFSAFMPVQESGHTHRLVRRIKTIKGRFMYRMACDPRFDYGRSPHQVELTADGAVFQERRGGGLHLLLRSPVALQRRDGAAVAELTLGEGESAAL